MLIKTSDPRTHVLASLEERLASASDDQRKAIEADLRKVRAGIQGEQDAAYLIDFDFRDSKNTAIIHDLRLDVDGRVAQIDHVLIHRTLNVFVIETKHFHAGIKINEEGEFLRWSERKKTFEGMASPLAQNDRHIAVLEKAFAQIEMPTRLGVRLTPTFHSVVLVSAQARIDRSRKFDTSCVIKADVLGKHVDSRLERQGLLGAMARFVGTETLEGIARGLVALHRPMVMGYGKRVMAKGGAQCDRVTTPAAAESVCGEESAVTHHANDVPLFEPSDAPQDAPKAATASPGAAVEAGASGGAPVCRGCGGSKLAILYGKFGYYFKCSDCSGNTPIKVACREEHRERIRKDGRRFYRECAGCGTSVLYFENPETSPAGE